MFVQISKKRRMHVSEVTLNAGGFNSTEGDLIS